MTTDRYSDLKNRLDKETGEILPSDIDEVDEINLGIIGEPDNQLESHHLRTVETLNALPTNKHGVLYPEFWRYYLPPFGRSFLYDAGDRYNDLIKILWGPRGGGKTVSGVTFSIVDGMMRGIASISNVPISWVAKDINGKLYKIVSIPFDVEAFANGDSSLKFKRLLIDEGNYLADRLRSTSNKNLAMTDILQQARKFRMCVDFCTINYTWLDPRVTGSLLDLKIECNDLYIDRTFRRKHKLEKGWRVAWDIWDMSGKCSGHISYDKAWMHTTLNARLFWNTYDTERFVDNKEARKRLSEPDKMIFDEYGKEVSKKQWQVKLKEKLIALVKSGLLLWKSKDLWDALCIDTIGLRQIAGRYMRNELGIDKVPGNNGDAVYDLSILVQ